MNMQSLNEKEIDAVNGGYWHAIAAYTAIANAAYDMYRGYRDFRQIP